MATRVNTLLLLSYVVLALAFSLVIEDFSSNGCCNGSLGFHVEAAVATTSGSSSRKMLHGTTSEQVFKSFPQVHNFHSSKEEEGVNLVDWALRAVPSGPDPMHHNVGGPKKPQAP